MAPQVESGVGGSTVKSIMKSETGRGRLKIWIIVIFGSLSFLIFFVGGTPVELRSGETSTRRRQIE